MTAFEQVLLEHAIDLVLVVGDVNSTIRMRARRLEAGNSDRAR
jgi:hypothetical protein